MSYDATEMFLIVWTAMASLILAFIYGTYVGRSRATSGEFAAALHEIATLTRSESEIKATVRKRAHELVDEYMDRDYKQEMARGDTVTINIKIDLI